MLGPNNFSMYIIALLDDIGFTCLNLYDGRGALFKAFLLTSSILSVSSSISKASAVVEDDDSVIVFVIE